MQRRLAEVKDRYFLCPFNTALALMRLRVREALVRKGRCGRRPPRMNRTTYISRL